MLLVSIIVFAIAAFGGATLAYLRFANRPLPLGLALLHGAVAATGLVLLIIALVVAASAPALATVALILFLAAAIGGAILFSFHLRKKDLPLPLVLIHGVAAVIAFLLLLTSAVG